MNIRVAKFDSDNILFLYLEGRNWAQPAERESGLSTPKSPMNTLAIN